MAPHLHPAIPSAPIVTHTGMKTVALIDPIWAGHHPMYFGQFSASFLRAGARVIAICPKPDDAHREILEAAGNLASHNRIHLEPLSPVKRSFFNGRFEGDPLRTFLRWKNAANAIDSALTKTGWKPDLVFFPYLDAYLRFLPIPSIPDITIGIPWSGLYLRNHHFAEKPSPLHRLRLLAKGDALMRSTSCREIGVLDERFNSAIANHTGKPVVSYPDVTQTLLPTTEPDLVRSIREKSLTRKITGIIGLEKRKGVLTLMRAALEAHRQNLPLYFVFAGNFIRSTFDPDELAWLESIATRIRNGEIQSIHFDPLSPRIPNEPEYNALFKSFHIAWAAYENFHGSSGTLSKAAAFEIPVIASTGECIGTRVKRHHTGILIPQADSSAALTAINQLAKGLDSNGETLRPDYETYRNLHSIEHLDHILAKLLD